MIGRADIAHALRPIFLLRLGQRGVRRREDDALSEGLVDQRIGGVVARMPHEGDAVDLGRDRLLELGQHRVGIPVREVVGDRRPEVEFGLAVAVIDVVGEHAALRSAREGGDLDALAPFGRRIGGVSRLRRLPTPGSSPQLHRPSVGTYSSYHIPSLAEPIACLRCVAMSTIAARPSTLLRRPSARY